MHHLARRLPRRIARALAKIRAAPIAACPQAQRDRGSKSFCVTSWRPDCRFLRQRIVAIRGCRRKHWHTSREAAEAIENEYALQIVSFRTHLSSTDRDRLRQRK